MGTRDRLDKLEAQAEGFVEMYFNNRAHNLKHIGILAKAIPKPSEIREIAREEIRKSIWEGEPGEITLGKLSDQVDRVTGLCNELKNAWCGQRKLIRKLAREEALKAILENLPKPMPELTFDPIPELEEEDWFADERSAQRKLEGVLQWLDRQMKAESWEQTRDSRARNKAYRKVKEFIERG